MAQHYDQGVMAIFDQLPSMTTPQLSCHELSKIELDYKKNDEKKDLQNCAQALCGLPKDNQTIIMKPKDFSQYADQEVLDKIKKIQPLIKKVAQKEKIEKIKALTKIQKAIESKQLDNIDLTNIEEFRYSEFLTSFFEIYSVPGSDYKNRLQAKFDIPDWMDRESREILKKHAEAAIVSINNNYSYFTMKELYSDSEIKKLLSEKIDKVESYIKADPSLENSYLRKNINNVKFKLQNNSPITSFDFMFDIASMNVSKLLEKKFICQTSDCAKFTRSYLKNTLTENKLESLLEKAKREAEEIAINRCQAKLVANLVQTENRKKAASIFQEAKTAIIEKVLPVFSAHSRELILKELEKIRFNGRLVRSLTEEKFMEDASDYLDPENSNTDEEEKTPAQLLSLYIDLAQNNFDEKLEGPCQSMSVASPKDEWLPGLQAISISDFSCIHEIKGKHIMAHELGHALSSIFSQLSISKESLESYLDMRKCVTGYYPQAAPKVGPFYKHDNQFTEEDMADLIGNMAFRNNRDLTACSFLNSDKSSTQYNDLTLFRAGSDPHSSDLQRLLTEAIAKGNTLPYSCTKIIEQTPNLDFKKCLK